MTTTKRTYDVTIIGGGVMGSSVAYWLARTQPLSVLVIERDPSYATASSALSASSIRQQFSTPICIAMSRFGMNFLKDIDQYLSVEGAAPDVGLVERGYLYLADQKGQVALRENINIQSSHGVCIKEFSSAMLRERYAWLETTDIALASLGLSGEGWFDGYTLLQSFKAKARSLGVTYIKGEAVGFSRNGARIESVKLATGEHISTGTVVDAAGPRAADVSRWANFDIPVEPERRSVFVFACHSELSDCPLIIDPSGLYFRPEGKYFITGGPAGARHGDPFDLTPDLSQFDDFIWPTLAHRVPAFESIKLMRAWAGHYEMNLFDHNALIGYVPGATNLVVVAGFSGHGMQHAAAAGLGVAELILYGAYQTLDLSALTPERLLSGQRLSERNII